MAIRKINHSRRVLSKKRINVSKIESSNIVEFNYKSDDIYDRKPMVFVLNIKGKILNGINIGYLKESVIENLLEEKDFKKLRYYSLYKKAFRTYKISNISMSNLIQYETLLERKQRLKVERENKL
tara:strand:+ start:143 stop:517 length:375 start_codon:yes stop_codon:yes gene_type:complete